MGKHSRQRAEQFAIRRWLQLGAASAGVSAALLGFSLAEQSIGVASADGADGSSATASAGDSGGSSAATGSRGPTAGAERDEPAGADDTDDAPDATRDDESDTDAEGDDDASAEPDADVDAGAEADEPDPVEADPGEETGTDRSGGDRNTDTETDDPIDAEPTAPVEDTAPAAPVVAAQTSVPSEAATTATPMLTHEERVAQKIATLNTAARAWIASLDVTDEAKANLEGLWVAVRRTWLNQAPTLDPVQVSGRVDGPITGTLNAVDADGDRLVYRVVRGPATGKVVLNADGTYTFTPGNRFDGVDTFVVRVVDVGLHVNLLDWFRPAAVRASSLINQGAITFDFRYGSGAEFWTEDARASLQRSADALAAYLMVMAPVVISYDVTAINDDSEDWLATAGSALVSSQPGFWSTIVQNKIITGRDANGAASDGAIEWNFATPWALGDVINEGEYDFVSTGMHELMHSFGFTSGLRESDNTRRSWSVFASFITSADGTRLIGRDHRWPSSADPYLTGGDGGLFFGGAHAIAAYGKPVPLYSPKPWEQGSSGSHLDTRTFTGDDYQMMNHSSRGVGLMDPRTLSAIEMGILRDLGYTVVAPAHVLEVLTSA